MKHILNKLKSLVMRDNKKVEFINFKKLSKSPIVEESEFSLNITSQEFIKQFLDSIKINRTDEFKEKYRTIKNLTILNIEDFQGKDGSSFILKDIVMNRGKTTLISRLSKNEILKSNRLCEDFKFLIS